uniref:Uncharacterized protein n=1 Tax=Anguilla anguilla TaxID=7936 RepID=A0A0E9RBI2_ANGAN
MCFKTLCVNE